MCKLICSKQKNNHILWLTKRIRLIVSAFIGILIATVPFVQAIEVGEAISIEGTADYRTDYEDTSLQLELIEEGLDIEVKYLLKTKPSESKVELLLLYGHIYTIGEGSQVSIIDELSDNKVSFALKIGTIRAVTSQSGGIRFETTTDGGVISARHSGYIVSCGPPATADLEICLYVGLYGESEVKSFTPPSQAVVLERQLYTYIQKGAAPSPNPPQKLDNLQFQELINKTTIVGTGKQKDHLDLTKVDELNSVYPLPPLQPQNDPQLKIPDVPLEEFNPLPLPPLPPIP